MGHPTIVRNLLSVGADPDALGGRKITPLGLAVAYRREDCCRLLLDAGAMADARMRRSAADTGHREIVDMLDTALDDRARAERIGAGRNNAEGAQKRFDFGGANL